MANVKYRKFDGKRYEQTETGESQGELGPLRANFMQYGYYVRVVESPTRGWLLYVRKKPVGRRKPSDAKMSGERYLTKGKVVYRQAATYRKKKSAAKERDRLRQTGWRVEIRSVPTGWGVYKEYTGPYKGRAPRRIR